MHSGSQPVNHLRRKSLLQFLIGNKKENDLIVIVLEGACFFVHSSDSQSVTRHLEDHWWNQLVRRKTI